MSISQDIQRAVLEKPGLTMRQVAEAIGRGDRAGVQGVSAQICQLCQKGKLRKDSVYAMTGVPRYWPTAATLADLRALRYTKLRKRTQPAAPARTAPARRQVAQVVRKPVDAAPKPVPKPTAQQQPKVLRAPLLRPRPAPNANAEAETVDAFLARGGTVERMPPSATSNPLRFDYPEAFA